MPMKKNLLKFPKKSIEKKNSVKKRVNWEKSNEKKVHEKYLIIWKWINMKNVKISCSSYHFT